MPVKCCNRNQIENKSKIDEQLSIDAITLSGNRFNLNANYSKSKRCHQQHKSLKWLTAFGLFSQEPSYCNALCCDTLPPTISALIQAIRVIQAQTRQQLVTKFEKSNIMPHYWVNLGVATFLFFVTSFFFFVLFVAHFCAHFSNEQNSPDTPKS